ncbi:MAG TPA: DEAD/DEAH box helicase [Tepidisphaeraceae bacterium]|jgi:hypothetical protein|nr:DEAD/DEAH box helicase [Tepidisphaeraceae bacterium]
MGISKEIVESFDRGVRERGEQSFLDGAVSIIQANENDIKAKVQGSRLYTVDIEFGEDEIEFYCTCPYAAEWGGPCKHAWATLLAADDRGLLPVADEDTESDDQRAVSRAKTLHRQADARQQSVPVWKATLNKLRRAAANPGHLMVQPDARPFPSDRRIVYLIDLVSTREQRRGIVVEVMTQKRLPSGAWDRPKKSTLAESQWLNAPDESDRMIALLMMGTRDPMYASSGNALFTIRSNRFESILRRICETGRCGVQYAPRQEGFEPLQWDTGGPWQFCIELSRSVGEKFVIVSGVLRRGEQRMALDQSSLILADGLMITNAHAAVVEHFGAWPFLQALQENQQIKVPIEQADDLLRELGAMPYLPKIQIAAELGFEVIEPQPLRRLRLARLRGAEFASSKLEARISFEYDGLAFSEEEPSDAKLDAERRRLIRRNHAAEAKAFGKLNALGFRQEWTTSGMLWVLHESLLHRAVMELTTAGWIVEAEGSIYRRPGNAKIEIRSSGIDWFELDGGVDFEGKLVSLPTLLAAMERGEQTVRLDDGSLGMLPKEWLSKYAALAGMGEASGDVLRFGKSQVGLLDALLVAMPEARCDETFERVRQEMRGFNQIAPADAPEGFGGTLREYQREGLGWLTFLQRFGFGGCLADDMGLGKTVQVLALLEMRRRAKAGPTLVVVPRSLVFNWKAEAERFTPQMRVLDHTGITRTRAADHFSQFDLILTTYGTLRRDAAYLKDMVFDYVILDEAQNIKNAGTEAAKATRLLRGKHRLVMTGTPIENRLGDLWSLFEFLNPGMLGAVSVFRRLVGNEASADGRQVLARALRPFILRRTKQQVAKDLPEKLEQTIFCELDTQQRKLYDELREHYRQKLLASVDTVGMNKSKMQVLEALLRLRQAACHPGLIDKARSDESSAKLDALTEQLNEVLDEGHKALVFSQFTSFLSLLRQRLDKENTIYEYLDGKTRDRQAKVERFQTDDACKLFLISLKAGGVGLNLTAADYVFLLDPWWNPAVESQAIDRTHRIGQTRRVFAYRLIAQDTVEEKVLKLQQTKRDLADAIITADNSVISKLKREDLELLLS